MGRYNIKVVNSNGKVSQFTVTLHKWGVGDQTARGRGLCLLKLTRSVPISKRMVAAAFAQIPDRFDVGSFECGSSEAHYYVFGKSGIKYVRDNHDIPDDLIGAAIFEKVV